MDDELIAILPDDYLSTLSANYLRTLVSDNRLSVEKLREIEASRGQAERQEQARLAAEAQAARQRQAAEERETRQRLATRLTRFGAEPDADWNIGDFIVVKQYLYDASYDTLPIRRVELIRNGEYLAVNIKDAIRIDNGEITPAQATDSRTTNDKTKWVKVNINAIPDLSNVNLNPIEQAYMERLLDPGVAARVQAERDTIEKNRLETTRTENEPRTRTPQTYGFVPTSGSQIKLALTDRAGLPDYTLLKLFKTTGFISNLRFIIVGPPQIAALRNAWGIPIFIPWVGSRLHPRPVQTIDQLIAQTADQRVHVTNAVTGMEITGPFPGLGLTAFPLAEVSVDDKLQARAGEHYYIAGHQNAFGVIAKSDYGTVNTTRQRFIYLKVFGYEGRSVSVRLDLLKKIGVPVQI
jgi:hypothetical protein